MAKHQLFSEVFSSPDRHSWLWAVRARRGKGVLEIRNGLSSPWLRQMQNVRSKIQAHRASDKRRTARRVCRVVGSIGLD